jgi:erythrocyte band 7 integral membrane protein
MDSPRTSTMDNGKTTSPTNGHAAGFRPQNAGVIKVQPPRREDLQPSYAQTLQGESEESNTNGWYGSMSTSRPLRAISQSTHLLTVTSQHSW